MIKNLNHQLGEGGAKAPSMEYEIQYQCPRRNPLPPFPVWLASLMWGEPGSSTTMGHSVVSGKTAQHHLRHRPLLQHHWSTWALRINQSQPVNPTSSHTLSWRRVPLFNQSYIWFQYVKWLEKTFLELWEKTVLSWRTRLTKKLHRRTFSL